MGDGEMGEEKERRGGEMERWERRDGEMGDGEMGEEK